MNKSIIFGTLLFISLFSLAFATQTHNVDICVYGGTSGGVIAGYTAQVLGFSVVLIEPGQHLGGMTSGGLGSTDIGNKFAITGLARDFYRRIGKHYGKLEQWTFEPNVAEKIFNDYVREAGLEVLFNYRIIDVKKENGWIKSALFERSDKSSETSNIIVNAKMFIDCTYEGDMMALAGVSYTVGREPNSQYGETLNGVQLRKGHQFPDGIDPYVIPGNHSSGLLPEISPDPLKTNGSGDKKVQAYNFRLCLCREDSNKIPVSRPNNYDPTRYELLLRLLAKEPGKSLSELFIINKMPNGKTDWNNRGGFSSDFIGNNYDYPEADYAKRVKIWQAHKDYTHGLLYFIGHDKRIPENLRKEMLNWGFCKDEFQDTNGWPHQLYIREARRMIGEYVMTEKNCTGEEIVNDEVGLAAYTMDSHNCQRIDVNGLVKNEGNVEVSVPGPYPIAYRSIVPKQRECKNLFVPFALSASHIAFGSIRMEPVFMVLGQSSAVAASMALQENKAVQDINVKTLQNRLKENPYLDNRILEILVDDSMTPGNITVTGKWTRIETSQWNMRKYGPSFLIDDNRDKGEKIIRFQPVIEAEGDYLVYMYWPDAYERATNVPIKIKHSKGAENLNVNMKKYSNDWFLLGAYHFVEGKDSYVEISNEGTDGMVIVDAVLFYPSFEQHYK